MARGQAVRQVSTSAHTVWQVLADHRGMATWGPGMAVDLEREGDPAPNGVGAIRAIKGPAMRLREEITAFEPEHHLAYRALSGIPLRDWTGDVELAEHAGSTTIRWTITAKAPLPGTDLVLRAVASVLLSALVRTVDKAR
jgi:uncharacterized protein YndB with AHSA1/START domain